MLRQLFIASVALSLAVFAAQESAFGKIVLLSVEQKVDVESSPGGKESKTNTILPPLSLIASTGGTTGDGRDLSSGGALARSVITASDSVLHAETWSEGYGYGNSFGIGNGSAESATTINLFIDSGEYDLALYANLFAPDRTNAMFSVELMHETNKLFGLVQDRNDLIVPEKTYVENQKLFLDPGEYRLVLKSSGSGRGWGGSGDSGQGVVKVTLTAAVPEPSAIVLALGLIGLSLAGRLESQDMPDRSSWLSSAKA